MMVSCATAAGVACALAIADLAVLFPKQLEYVGTGLQAGYRPAHRTVAVGMQRRGDVDAVKRQLERARGSGPSRIR